MNILQIIYDVVAGPVLAIIAAIGLYQLKIVKDAARMSAKREAYKLASEQCANYLTHIIPLVNDFNRTVQEKNAIVFTKSVIIVEAKSVKITYPPEVNIKDNLKSSHFVEETLLISEVMKVSNLLDAFAVMFVSGVADESVGFSAVGRSYCASVRKVLPTLELMGAGKDYFENLMKLFFIWNLRLDAMKLQDDRDTIENRLSGMEKTKIEILGAR